ncbi:MAG TPA: phosphoglycerate kinase [Flavobacteriaceae bacterium]|nr:phosphoglycerate kinase [Flavobacteriaceae bacterium]
MKTIKDFDFSNKKALIRVDFNVPRNEGNEVTDTTRIQAAKPSIDYILKKGGTCVLMSHLGRPKGKEEDLSLKHIVNAVSETLGVPVTFIDDCIGEEVQQKIKSLPAGSVVLLENLRFYEEEQNGEEDFAMALAKNGDIYVNDAFGTAHRKHASTAVIVDYFDGNVCFGLLLASEIESINKVLHDNNKPVTAIIGGAKVSSKITIIENILDAIDHLIIGGGMAFTFIKAKGGQVGSSLVEDDKLEVALQVLKKAKEKNVTVHLPIDVIAADAFKNDADKQTVLANAIPEGWMGLDNGPKSNAAFREVILQSKTILWNGPVGVFEMTSFEEGTKAIGKAIADSTKNGAFSLVGGGDSVAAAKQFGFTNAMSYISTGGGAMLEMLEGKALPGIVAVQKQAK